MQDKEALNVKEMLGENYRPIFDNFEKYTRRQAISRFIARYEIFKLQLGTKGSIVECGVHYGGGLMAWAKLSSALEPYALDRRIFGFDTFSGFPSVVSEDKGTENPEVKDGGLDTGVAIDEELEELIGDYDENRYLNQIPKIELIKGDATQTIPEFVESHPHLVVSLLFLDFDLYEPTKVALQHLLPRMPKGAILAFDEVNNEWWPGETVAVCEELGLPKLELKRFSFDPNIAYARL